MIKKWLLNILIFIVVSLIAWLLNNYYESRVENEGVYVIGEVLGFRKGVKRSNIIEFSFEFRGGEYVSGGDVNKKNNELIGRRYLVKIVPDNPKINKILFNKRITCDTLTAPYNGWKEIPSHFPFYQDHEGNLYISYPCIYYDSNYLEKIYEEIDQKIK